MNTVRRISLKEVAYAVPALRFCAGASTNCCRYHCYFRSSSSSGFCQASTGSHRRYATAALTKHQPNPSPARPPRHRSFVSSSQKPSPTGAAATATPSRAASSMADPGAAETSSSAGADAGAGTADSSRADASSRANTNTNSSPPAAGPDAAPIFSSNVSDHEAALQALGGLLVPRGAWTLSASRKGLEREVRFKTFKATWAFMDAVAAECGRERHHPEWANVYSRVHVRWTTHRPEGLSLKDLRMAEVCDEKAVEFGELQEAAGVSVVEGGKGDALTDLSEHIGKDACDVCAR